MKKNLISIVFIVLALVFVIIGLLGPWYSSHMKMSSMGMNMEVNSDISLTRADATQIMNGQTSTESISINDIKKQYDATGMDTSFIDAISNAFIITIITLIFAIIAMVFAIISLFKPKLQIIGGIFAILLFVFMLVAPIIFMVGFTSFVETQAASFGYSEDASQIGFWFSKSEGGSEISMGPGYAWYLMIIGAIFALIGGIILFLKQKQPMSVPPQVNPPM